MFPEPTVILVGVVTEDVPTGFVVFQEIFEVQELPPEEIVQLEAEMVPDGGNGIILLAEQEADIPPSVLSQDQFQGPEPDTPEAVPVLQSPEAGAEEKLPPFDDPQTPS